MHKLYQNVLYAWYRYPLLFIPLWPVSLIYRLISYLRRLFYEKHWLQQTSVNSPVIVVGNLLVGGTGKTPMVIALVNFLKSAGFKPGVITRGYGGINSDQNTEVTANSCPKIVGDEPVLIAIQTQVPVVKNKNRVLAAQTLSHCDVIISDDGLQYYPLKADIKIAMQPDANWLHNPFCLPAGPWREPKFRLNHVDFVQQLAIAIEGVYLLNDSVKNIESIAQFKRQTVHAVCAIAAPWRFFDLLNQQGMDIIAHAHPDHGLLTAHDFNFNDDYPIFITEKDAVKCKDLQLPKVWVVKLKIQLDKTFTTALLNKLSSIRKTA